MHVLPNYAPFFMLLTFAINQLIENYLDDPTTDSNTYQSNVSACAYGNNRLPHKINRMRSHNFTISAGLILLCFL